MTCRRHPQLGDRNERWKRRPGTAAAVANAVYDAIGVRVRDLPITPERILRGPGGGARPGAGAAQVEGRHDWGYWRVT